MSLDLPIENRIGIFAIWGLFAAPFIDGIKL